MAKTDEETIEIVHQAFDHWKQDDPKLVCQIRGEDGVVYDLVPHHAADGTIKHYCTALYCPDLHGVTS